MIRRPDPLPIALLAVLLLFNALLGFPARAGRQEPAPAAGAQTQAPARAAAAAVPPPTLALLVGIDEYQQPATQGRELGHLHGAQNDIARVRELLEGRFGFAPATIVSLIGEQATHEAIVRAFHDHLLAKAGPETQVVFWFSGHGSRVPDPTGKDTGERDVDDQACDDSMLAYDSRAGDRFGSYDLTDDELHSLLSRLPGPDVLVVTDCCHSGGLLRGPRRPDAGIRYAGDGEQPLDRAALARFWPSDVPFLDDDSGDLATTAVHVAACGSLQEAGEFPCEDGRTYGTLTWFLTDVLMEVDRRTSWEGVAETVRARVAGCGTRGNQVVQAHGHVERAIFGGRGKALPPGYLVRPRDAGSLIIEAGRIHGLVEGATARLIDLDNRERGTARVVQSRYSSCDAVWNGDTPMPHGVALRAVPATGLQGRAPLCLRLGEGVDARLLEQCPWGAAGAGENFDYALTRKGESLMLEQRGGGFAQTFPRTSEALQAALFHAHCFRSLWEAVAQPGRHQLEIAVAPADNADIQRSLDQENARRRADGAAAVAAVPKPAQVRANGQAQAVVGASYLDQEWGTGSFVALTVSNHGDEPLHVAVLSVTEGHVINVIWGAKSNNVLAPGASHTCLVEVGPERGWQLPRPMIDRYVAIATPRHADFKPFESSAAIERDRGPERGEDSPLPAFLAGALHGATTRGADPQPAGWGIAWLDLELVLPEQFARLTRR